MVVTPNGCRKPLLIGGVVRHCGDENYRCMGCRNRQRNDPLNMARAARLLKQLTERPRFWARGVR